MLNQTLTYIAPKMVFEYHQMTQDKPRLGIMKSLWIVGVLTLLPGTVLAQTTGSSYTTVANVLLADGEFGGCMANLAAMPTNNVCGNAGSSGYVSFMCDGSNGVTKSGAIQRYDSAFAAMLLGKNVYISITNEKLTPEGYCYVYDIRIAP